MMPEDWFSICLIGAPASRMLVERAGPRRRRAWTAAAAELMPRDDRLHVVLDAEQEAGDELAALRLAGVEERGGGGLEAAGDDLVDQVDGELLVAVGQARAVMHDAVLVALQVALAVERLERVGGVVLERAEEGLEAELLRVRQVVRAAAMKSHRVLVDGRVLVVLVLDQVVELLLAGRGRRRCSG